MGRVTFLVSSWKLIALFFKRKGKLISLSVLPVPIYLLLLVFVS
jgi:hypothetical protein